MRRKGKIAVIAVLVLLVAAAAVFGIIYGDRQGETSVNGGLARIHLSDGDMTVSGAGIAMDQKKIIISKGGTYYFDGELSDGQIYVKTGDEDTVTLCMNGVTISNKTDHPIHIENAKETILTSEGQELNTITSGADGSVDSNKDTQIAAVYSRDDLTIEKGNYRVTASGDGIHSNDDITITGGGITIQCGDDGIHANEELTVKDGSITVKQSYEGLEANQIRIEGGEHMIQSSDDGINANGGQNSFGGGGFGGKIGGEDPGAARPGGAKPDGTKPDFRKDQADARTDTGDEAGGREKEDETSDEGKDDDADTEKTPNLIISGGKLTVDAQGDGLDSNGNLIVTGGEIIVDGPSSDGNGALDSGSENGGDCRIEGGTIIAVGSSGMAETFDSSSTQHSFRYNFESRLAENTEISILDEDGKEIYRHVCKRAAASVVFSSAKLEGGKKYTIKAGDQTEEITLEDVSSTFGTETRGMGGRGHGGSGMRPGGTL